MLVRGRLVSLGFVLLSAVVSGGSCAGGADDQTPIGATPGGAQPAAGEAEIDEDEACDRLVTAEEKARRRLNCPDLNRPECPGYVRPAGTGCWMYDEDSLAACEAAIQAYELCSDFLQRPCVVTAVAIEAKHCPALGAGGESGQGGASGAAGAGQGGQSGHGAEPNSSTSGQPGSGGTNAQGGASGESGHAGAAG
jgi:hypothetical protein